MQTQNTVTWVDEGYAKRLARQAAQHVTEADEASALLRLDSLRRSSLHIVDMPAKVGFGAKRGTAAFHLDTLLEGTLAGWLGIYRLDFDRHGKVVGKSFDRSAVCLVSKHAVERLFERLRTNSLDDVTRKALNPLCRLRPEDFMAEAVKVPGVGEFRGVHDRFLLASTGETHLVWLAKTFISN